ncbi:MAG TPA: ATP-binding protein [Candidatus Glassbacteria bacterium]|nr:ATP-binding protein [Candidatus Glassbacteria bacterium]
MTISRKILDAENNLTKERVAKLLKILQIKEEDIVDCGPRPQDSLIDLMHWVKLSYMYSPRSIKDTDDVVCIINNAIGVDGSFVQFCELNGTHIEPLSIDSVSSWKTETGTEDFMIQGIFRIKCEKFSFIHAALFHKGNQYEDEISYFVLVEKNDYIKYVDFRNSYTEWQKSRINQVLEVKVFGGDDYIYDKNMNWKDLFLPNNLKKEIKLFIEDFLGSQKEFEKYNLPWKRGFIVHGPPGAGKTRLINTIISEYNLMPVTISGEDADDFTLAEAFKYAEQNGPSIIFLEELDELLDGSVDVRFLAELLDGMNPVNGVLVVATTNRLKELQKMKNIIDRPSRFDRKWKIPLPDESLAMKYLRKWFAKSKLTTSILKPFVQQMVANKFSYAHIKEFYITSMFIAKREKEEFPNVEALKEALSIIINEKNQITNIEDEDTSPAGDDFGFH